MSVGVLDRGSLQNVGKQLVAKIYSLVDNAVKFVDETRCHLKIHVESLGLPMEVYQGNWRYFPTKKDFHNHMVTARIRGNMSAC